MKIFYDALASADADDQAEFFNGFYRHLRVMCKGREDTQIAYIADRLDENGRMLAESLHEFSKLAVEARAKHESEIQNLYQQKHELEKEIEALNKQKETIENP